MSTVVKEEKGPLPLDDQVEPHDEDRDDELSDDGNGEEEEESDGEFEEEESDGVIREHEGSFQNSKLIIAHNDLLFTPIPWYRLSLSFVITDSLITLIAVQRPVHITRHKPSVHVDPPNFSQLPSTTRVKLKEVRQTYSILNSFIPTDCV